MEFLEYALGRASYKYSFREPVYLWFNAVSDNKVLREAQVAGYSPMGDEYAKLVEKVSCAIGTDVGLTTEQMKLRGTVVLYPFDMTAMPEKKKKIQTVLREHLPALRKYDPDMMSLMMQLERARYESVRPAAGG